MSEIGPIRSTPPTSALRGKAPVSVSSTPAAPSRPGDQVQLSDQARLLSQLSTIPEVRQEKIDLAKSRIASGFYDNESVTDQTIDKLAHELSD